MIGAGVLAVAVEMLSATADQPATESDESGSAWGPWRGIAVGTRDGAMSGARAACRGAVEFGNRSGAALGFAASLIGGGSVQAARSGRHAAAVAGRAAGQAGAGTGRAVGGAGVRAGHATGRAGMRAGEATARASLRTGRAAGQASARAARTAGAIARRGGTAVAVTASRIEASTLAVIGAGTVRTAAFARRASVATRRSGVRAAGGTAAATRRAAAHLVPDPVALPDQAVEGVLPDQAVEGDAGAEHEPVTVGVAPASAPTTVSTMTTTAPESGLAAPQDDGWRPLRQRPERGQVVPLRPRATTRLKATGELLVLVAVLGLVVSSVIVALAVAANYALSGL